jgi:hypothetical protein
MSSLPIPVRALAAGIAFALVSLAPANAKTVKHPHKRAVAAHHAKTAASCRGANLFPCGPVYFDNKYLGDDPDPFIRSQLLRTYGHSASLF